MKEFKYCHEEITMGVEIPVTVCETQKEMVSIIVDYRDSFKFAMERLDEVMKSYENGGFDYEDVFGRMKRNERAYHRAIDTALGGTDEETVYIIYKDGSTYFQNGGMGCEGKFKRTGIARAMISTAYEAIVFGDFAITEYGDVSIDESDIEEYGVYAGQYDVKEQEAQEVQEAEQETAETVEGISKMETTTEADDSGFEYTTSQAQEIIMTGTSIAREKYREKHNIHNPMDLKKFSKKQLDDYLSKELDYINKFLNDTIPKEVFNTMKGETMYA